MNNDTSAARAVRTLLVAAMAAAAALPAEAVVYKVLGWNDLGMHCMDADYSVFSILPPFNNLHAQVVNVSTGKLVTSGVSVTFEATPDLTGSINTYSAGKTNFWGYALPLFGANLAPNVGLGGWSTASLAPQAMSFVQASSMWQAVGIPITPYDDARAKNTYPMVKVVARDAAGGALGEGHIVLPVSDEMTCIACHGSGSGAAAQPAHGWVNDPRGPEQDYRRNILSLHDDRQLGQPAFQAALLQLGYSPAGLLATADGGRPILCAACHLSNALPGTGIAGISAMTQATHTLHAEVIDPSTGLKLGDEANRQACYMCHPGSTTQCLRGVMGNAKNPDGSLAIQCQNCHSTMAKVGSPQRTGWLDQPTCQGCHHDGKRDLSAVDSQGNPKKPADKRFATNSDVPSAGFSLYRFSTGHGGLQCEACHGSTHAEYASSHDADNVQSTEVQGHVGTISECVACHAKQPVSAKGGPHGLHSIGQAWVNKHGRFAEGGTAACAYCHGADFRGGPLATVKAPRKFLVEDRRRVNYTVGQQVTCYDCHGGPGGGLAPADATLKAR
jgi:hypothetical protein